MLVFVMLLDFDVFEFGYCIDVFIIVIGNVDYDGLIFVYSGCEFNGVCYCMGCFQSRYDVFDMGQFLEVFYCFVISD